MVIQTNVIQILRKLLTTATQNTFLRQIMNAFSLFSREEISHEKKPQNLLPSLTELTARKIIDTSVQFLHEFYSVRITELFIGKKKIFAGIVGEHFLIIISK